MRHATPPPPRPRLRAVLTMLAVAAALTGCAGETAGEAGSGGAADTAVQVKAYDINPTPRDAVKDGGTLRWGIPEFPAQWNLHHVDGNLAVVERVVGALLPKPFLSDEKGTISANPDYLLDGRVTATAPRQVVTLTLNPKARWSNGRPITWRDYRSQWTALRGRDVRYRVAATTGYQDIADVRRGKDDFQVVITFATPFGDWRSLFGPLYPQETTSSPHSFNTGWLNRIPITAGPFRFAGFDRRAKTITLVRDDGWWGNRAKLDRIVYRVLSSDALIGAFTDGELDLVDLGPSAADYRRAAATPGAEVRQAAGPDFRQLTLNGESPRLADPRVRRAIAMGIDRQAIARSDLQGLNWPVTLLNNHFFMNTQQGYQDNAGELGRYDPERAARLLDAAGWQLPGTPPGGVRRKNGEELHLRFVIPAGLRLSKSEGELVQAMLQRIGVRVTLQAVPGDAFFAEYIIPGNYDLAPFSYIGTPYPVTSGYGQYANAVTDAAGRKQWHANLGRIGSPKIDAAMRKAAAELDPERARAAANAADRLIWRAVNVLPLYQRPQYVAVRETLANIGARGFYDLRYADIGFTA